MNRWLIVAATLGLAYWLYRKDKSEAAQAVSDGGERTGVVRRTYNNRPPNYPQEAIGYGVRDWAEVKHADGSVSWTEIKT